MWPTLTKPVSLCYNPVVEAKEHLIMKETPINLVCQQSTMQGLIVPEDMPLEEAINQFASDPGLHGIFLVDDNQRLVGDWARLKFHLPPKGNPFSVGKTRRLMSAKTAKDLAMVDSHQMAVRLTDTLADALIKMEQYNLEDIAVVNNEGHIVNDLRLSEVLIFALQVK